ncbi:hypothetical protein PVAND_014262 [Polypedilum vanderplanki]|uniref:Peptidase M14 domain-containing protein n=1 Tax=Polypedilum vanderplanki TaxID=319348 RepID=A0A9J6CSL0_POLVA|nr:hypothetical protein PVAND_014262 [Polypedilum vanderplanki]
MVRIFNDFEFWGDYADDEIRERHIAVGREIKLDKYYFGYEKQKREENCLFCGDKIDMDFNRFDVFMEHNDIKKNNHFDSNPHSSLPKLDKKYEFDADVAPCWCNNMPQFSRSSVGGSKYLLSAQPYALEQDDLIFESRFESGNLARVVKVTPHYYELYLRPDMYTNRHTQWFYFRVKNTRTKTQYRFSIVNLTKPDSLYKEGMRPLMYSTADATNNNIGWRRCGENIAYYRNEDNNIYNTRNYHQVLIDDFDDEDNGNICSYTLTFNVEFQYENDTVFFAHSYPYTYSDLQDYLMNIQRHPIKSKFSKLRLLCRSLAGNNVYYLTVTAPSTPEEELQKKKKAIVVTARVHPGEAPSSWMMKGFIDFITGDSYVAKKLRHKFIFKLVPMLNPDGVIVGNTRSSLTGRDLNRQYRTVIRETYPSIWNTKAMIKRLMEDCGVALYCDMHAHSRKHNIFAYGCENLKRHPDRRLIEQVFPLMLHKNVADKFSFENCKFRVQKNKEGTGRIVVWLLGVTNSYTLEASFAGSTLGSRNGTHFSTMDYEQLGRAFCETLMDYYDDNPLKVNKFMPLLKKMRKEQRKARKALKAKRKAELLTKKEEKEKNKKEERLLNQSNDYDNNYYQEYYQEQEKIKRFLRFTIEDSFNWDELEEELQKRHEQKENIEASEDDDEELSDCENDKE